MLVHILIADDHELARKAVRAVLERRDDFDVCCEACNGKEAVRKALEFHPDVVILDIGMPVLNGLDAARLIKQSLPETPIIFLSAHDPRQVLTEVRDIGVQGYVLKSDAGETLIKAVDAAACHQTFFPQN